MIDSFFRFFECIHNHSKYLRTITICICHYIKNGTSIRIFQIIPSSPFASGCLMNLKFLLSDIANFDEWSVFLFFVFASFAFLLSVFFQYFKQQDIIVL